jgi:hypothetical protein
MLLAEHVATCHTQTTKGIVGTGQGSKTSSTQTGKVSQKTSTRLSYQSTSKGTLYQRHLKQHWWQLKHTCIQRDQIQETQGSICIVEALQGLKMVGNKLSAKEEEAYCNKGTHKPRSPRRHSGPRHRSGSRRSRTPSTGRHKSPKHEGTRRSRTPSKAYDYEDNEKEMGASCFTHRVRTTPVPKGFKLPHD